MIVAEGASIVQDFVGARYVLAVQPWLLGIPSKPRAGLVARRAPLPFLVCRHVLIIDWHGVFHLTSTKDRLVYVCTVLNAGVAHTTCVFSHSVIHV